MGFFSDVTDEIRSVATAVAPILRQGLRKTEAIVKEVTSTTVETAKDAKDAVEFIGHEIDQSARKAAADTVTLAKKAREEAKALGRAAVSGAKKIARKTKEGVIKIFKLAKEAFNKTLKIADVALCKASKFVINLLATGVNELENSVAGLLSLALANPASEKLIRLINESIDDVFPSERSADERRDGRKTDSRTCGFGKDGGVKPEKCDTNPPKVLPKSIYINGINTTHDTHCKTLLKLSDSTCREFTGIYNSTSGTIKDVIECVDNIQRQFSTPAQRLSHEVLSSLRKEPPEEVDLYAHSQGGLITQAALVSVKKKLVEDYLTMQCHGREPTPTDNAAAETSANERLKHVRVKSFGTAILGWPKGPKYENYTNAADPVPRVILSAQMNNMGQTFDDTTIVKPHVFLDPHFNPINSHSMDDVYIPEMQKNEPAPKCFCKAA